MKKAFGQTVRDIKREVNKKVLKVPSIEQKVLDATSNEPWGPHGLLLADIAQATRNYHEHQMIMGVLWKRINDTGKNWRHVYKVLTVLEYLVAHGSERVIDEIREHAYQISTLSDFQYIDSSGRDQGNNVRKKSQSLVVLVNDKERIEEVRQKAAANRDKYRNTSMGHMNQNSSSGGYGDRYDDDRYDGRYGNRDDDRNGYRDDERYGRYGDSYGREGDKYSRDYEDRYSRDGSRDDEYRGRGQSSNDYHYGSRGGSADFDKDRAYEDDVQYSSRGSGAKADDHSQDGSTMGKRLDRKYSEQNIGAPPSYEDAISATRSPSYSERTGESSPASAAKASVPLAGASPSHEINAASPPPVPASPPAQVSAQDTTQEVNGFDEFDPRGSFSATPATSNDFAPATSADKEIDLLGSLSESLSSNSLALVPATEPTMTPETQASGSFSSGSPFAATSAASTIPNQSFDDPFGDGPFKAIPSTYGIPAQEQLPAPSSSFNPHYSQSFDVHKPAQLAGTDFGSGHDDLSYIQSVPSGVQPPTNPQFSQQDSLTFNQEIDILADILPPSIPSGYSVPANRNVSQTGFPPEANQPSQLGLPSLTNQNSFQAQTGQDPSFLAQLGQPPPQTSYPLQSAEPASQTSILAHSMALTFPAQSGQPSQMGFYSQNGQPTYLTGYQSQMGSSNASFQASPVVQSALSNTPNPNFYAIHQQQDVSTGPNSINMIPPSSGGQIVQHNFQPANPTASSFAPQAPQVLPNSIPSPVSSLPASLGSSTTVPQPTKDKFEMKSTVWADTLSRGLVNLNISGPKTNPLADIGVDFDSINRKEKRMEKPTTAPVTSTVTMGKAMGSGSGMGRAGATALRPPPNPVMGPSVNMTGVPGAGMGMAGGYGVNQTMVRGMGMNISMGQGISMQQQAGFPPGSAMPGGYNPMMGGAGNYSQRPYGGGY